MPLIDVVNPPQVATPVADALALPDTTTTLATATSNATLTTFLTEKRLFSMILSLMSDGENENRYEYLTGLLITFLQNIHPCRPPIHTIARIRNSGAGTGAAGMRQPVKNPVPAAQGRKHAGHWWAFGSDREGVCVVGFHNHNTSHVDMTCQPPDTKKFRSVHNTMVCLQFSYF